ncbi:MAG: hypothetical protein JOZ14_06605 [Acidobacteria bacterium]|nr:hypothetical protein [Acidobacteriota bacterium]
MIQAFSFLLLLADVVSDYSLKGASNVGYALANPLRLALSTLQITALGFAGD